jgi:hypothetical protein
MLKERPMQLFKSQMFLLHPPQTSAYRRRRRYGCRTPSVSPPPSTPPMSDALCQSSAAAFSPPLVGQEDRRAAHS